MRADTPTPNVGQVWADDGSSSRGRRTLRIDEDRSGLLICTVLTDLDGQCAPEGRRIRLLATTLTHPLAGPYRLLAGP